ncbi:MAG: ribokinase [Dehalococcoidia bacterium]|jgi:sugar/nucleoside kinase (ribokinase family)|nr:MAG: ribokinase [Dehalococcoidia bacterium]
MNAPDFLAIGHATRDLGRGGWTLGGGVVFAMQAAYALGRRPAMVTSGDVRDLLGQIPGLMKVTPAATTTFENVYTPAGRQQTLHARAADLTLDDIPLAWRAAPVVLLVPLCHEIAPALVDAFPASCVVAGIQGWLRTWDHSGRITPRRLPAGVAFGGAAAVTASIEDLAGDEAAARELADRCRVVAITRGHAGVTLFQDGEPISLPGLPVVERMPTGAGDVFATAFAIRLAETNDPVEAASFANVAAAIWVAGEGMPRRAAIAARRAEAA